MTQPTTRRTSGGAQRTYRSRAGTSPTKLALWVTIALLIVFPMPALLTTLVPARVIPDGLLPVLAALGICASALLVWPRGLWSMRRGLRPGLGRPPLYLAAGIVAAAVMTGSLLARDEDRSGLEFYVAPGDVTRIAAGDSPSPISVLIEPHGVEGQFVVAVDGSGAAWSEQVELRGPAISVALPMKWNEIEKIRLIDESKGSVLRELSLVTGN